MPGRQPPPAATTAFQPMRPSAILGTAFRLYRRHWRTLLPIVALVVFAVVAGAVTGAAVAAVPGASEA